ALADPAHQVVLDVGGDGLEQDEEGQAEHRQPKHVHVLGDEQAVDDRLDQQDREAVEGRHDEHRQAGPAEAAQVGPQVAAEALGRAHERPPAGIAASRAAAARSAAPGVPSEARTASRSARVRAACPASSRNLAASVAARSAVASRWISSGTTVLPASRLAIAMCFTLISARAIAYVGQESL